MKNEKLFIRITLCSLLTLIVYIIGFPIIGAINGYNAEAASPFIAMLLLSIFIMILYPLIFISLYYIRGGAIEDSLFKKDDYHGIKNDLQIFLKSEKVFFLTILAINTGSWLLINLERLIFGKRMLTAILIVYMPINILNVVFPDWLMQFPAYLVSSICIYFIYIAELAVVRKMTYNNLYPKK